MRLSVELQTMVSSSLRDLYVFESAPQRWRWHTLRVRWHGRAALADCGRSRVGTVSSPPGAAPSAAAGHALAAGLVLGGYTRSAISGELRCGWRLQLLL